MKQLEIKNVQSHVETVIDFHPGVNMVTGPTDAGKSAIVRALEYVARNRPSGDSLRRHKTKKTTVTLDGVTKLRTASKHQYIIGDTIYKALGTGVPEEVTNTLNLRSENFQTQHQPMFLLTDTPGQRAKTLNKVADLGIIDSSREEIKKKIRETVVGEKLLASDIKEQKEKVDQCAWVVDADIEYKVYEGLIEEVNKIETKDLQEKILLVDKLQKEAKGFPVVDSDLTVINELVTALDIDMSISSVIKNVEDNEVDYPDTGVDAKKIDSLINHLEADNSKLYSVINEGEVASYNFDQFPDVDEPPVDLIAELSTVIEDEERLSNALNEVLITEDCLEDAVVKYSEGSQTYDANLKELGTCPLCEGEL